MFLVQHATGDISAIINPLNTLLSEIKTVAEKIVQTELKILSSIEQEKGIEINKAIADSEITEIKDLSEILKIFLQTLSETGTHSICQDGDDKVFLEIQYVDISTSHTRLCKSASARVMSHLMDSSFTRKAIETFMAKMICTTDMEKDVKKQANEWLLKLEKLEKNAKQK